MIKEVMDTLSPTDGGAYLDATFGGGGYSRYILDSGNCLLWAIDRDPDASLRAQDFKKSYGPRFNFTEGSFSNIPSLIPNQKFDGIVFDFGVSSFQLDEAHRGFSFRYDGPLDMRMSQEGPTAADVVNSYNETDLAHIIYTYGEEPRSRQIASAIVKKRKIKKIETTLELADIVREIVKKKDGLDPATLTFQALRIFVNNELIEIDTALKEALKVLKVGGVLVSVSFHALEDRLVKQIFKHTLVRGDGGQFMFKTLNSKPLLPTRDEIKNNPRSRSARLRAANCIFLADQEKRGEA